MDKKKIFIADDEEACLFLKDALISRGFEAQAVRNSKEIMPAIRLFKPDVAILDLLMPDYGGLEIAQMINDDDELRGLPIIIISGLNDIADIKKSYKLGAVSYFVKPFKMEDLVKEINKAISYKEKNQR